MEIWKDIKGYEGLYQVSNYGRIKSLARRVRSGNNSTATRLKRESIRKPVFNKANKQYSILLRKDGGVANFFVSQLVADAFVDNPDNLPWLIFVDGDRLNPHASNLLYISRDERLELLRDNKPDNPKPKSKGYGGYRTQLDKHKRDDIRIRRASGETYASIAKRYSIAESTVFKICRATLQAPPSAAKVDLQAQAEA